ncbi:MAG TPA: DoxX family protein [Lapillicoccus sp.]|nr:DoxX family protein [Lapillicoccus sp.]
MSSTFPERTTMDDDSDRTTALRPFGVGSSAEQEWEDPVEPAPPKTRHIIDRWDGALGLFVLRVVVAAIFIIRGLQKVQHLDVTRTQFEQVGVPYANTMAVVVGVFEVAIAIALVFGIAMRMVGLGIATIAIGALVYVKWRTGAVFTDGQPGFAGELELLLAAVGLMFAGVGGGGWTVDRRFRRR